MAEVRMVVKQNYFKNRSESARSSYRDRDRQEVFNAQSKELQIDVIFDVGVQYIRWWNPSLNNFNKTPEILEEKVLNFFQGYVTKYGHRRISGKNKGFPFTIDFRSVEGATLRPISDIVGIIALLSRGRLGGTLISRDEVHLHINKVCRCKS